MHRRWRGYQATVPVPPRRSEIILQFLCIIWVHAATIVEARRLAVRLPNGREADRGGAWRLVKAASAAAGEHYWESEIRAFEVFLTQMRMMASTVTQQTNSAPSRLAARL